MLLSAARPDGSSQGGYLVLLAPRHILETKEDVYHILDWKSSKLPRVARSSLSAEAQAAGLASDATEFACRYYEHLLHPLVSLGSALADDVCFGTRAYHGRESGV